MGIICCCACSTIDISIFIIFGKVGLFMKVQTQNRLAHYQVEYQEVREQTCMLQNQMSYLQNQLINLQQYLSVNNGDKMARQNFRRVQRELNSAKSQIFRNMRRLSTLERQINTEGLKVMRGR